MRVELLLFAGLREALGGDTVHAEVTATSTYADLKRQLAERHPEAASLVAASRIAAAGQFTRDTDPVDTSAELALIPPVSGG